jgi:hypothetical protein
MLRLISSWLLAAAAAARATLSGSCIRWWKRWIVQLVTISLAAPNAGLFLAADKLFATSFSPLCKLLDGMVCPTKQHWLCAVDLAGTA